MKLAISDYVRLSHAGYTDDEINDYIKSVDKSVENVEKPSKPEKPNEDPKPKAEDPKPEQPQENETQQMLREMLGLIKKGNINNMSHSGSNAEDPAQIMASILAPEHKEVNNNG